jgi:hypothetical protein
MLAGCGSKDEDHSPTTVAEDKENIQASFDRTKSLIQKFRDGTLYKFAEEFIDYREEYKEEEYYHYVGNYYYGRRGDYTYNSQTGKYDYTPGQGDYDRSSYGYYDDVISEFATLLGEKLDDKVDFDAIEENKRFDFASYAGKYTWSKSKEVWDRTSHTSIAVYFPSSEAAAANDCEAGITAYTDVRCDIEGKTVYLPTKASAYFSKGGATLASADVTADYTGRGIPKTATANVYAKPVKLNASLSQETASKYKASVAIADEDDDNNNLSITAEAVLSNAIDSYTDFDDCQINNLHFTVTQSALAIKGSIDLKTLNNTNNPSTEDINKLINFEVSYNNQKTGTLQVEEVGGDRYLFIYYKDGTKENTSIYYDGFVKDVEHIFKK